jgi:hypothetical protein
MRDIDDGKAAVSETHAAVEVITRSVGAAMRDSIGHAAENSTIYGVYAGEVEYACDSTHCV